MELGGLLPALQNSLSPAGLAAGLSLLCLNSCRSAPVGPAVKKSRNRGEKPLAETSGIW